ncbi:MAG: hypothetical protein Q9227_000753 [Pyrenula ochraceoflavens]
MNPHQRNKIDVNSLSPDEQRLFRLYGRLPNKKDLLQNKLKGQERKYFDSGDYALSKAGKASDSGVTTIGSEHPQPENIPHVSSPPNNPTPISDNTPNSINIGSPGANLPPGPGGMHRGSIQGIPGGNLPGGATSAAAGAGKSPGKEGGSYLGREVSEEEGTGEVEKGEEGDLAAAGAGGRGIPIRR